MKKILIIEDNYNIASLYRDIILELFKNYVYVDIAGKLEDLKNTRYDFVISDWQLTHYNADKIIDSIEYNDIVILTSFHRNPLLDNYIKKKNIDKIHILPIDIPLLKKIIENALEINKL